jgi:hypothetical protein
LNEIKSFYRHKRSSDIFAIEIGDDDHVLSTNGPLYSGDLAPKFLDYDEYWNTEIEVKLDDFVRITKDDYIEILRQNGFYSQFTQNYLF